jgi:hypothetical protein
MTTEEVTTEEVTKERLTFHEENNVFEKRLRDVDRIRYDQAAMNGEREVVLTEGVAIIGKEKSTYILHNKSYILKRWTSIYFEYANW